MAGEWIKVRTNLWDDTRVSGLCDRTGQPEAMIIGGLYWLWATADEHTEDGLCNGLSVTGLDRKTGIKGFGAALVAINWLEETPEGIKMLRFEEHNGASAKARATTAKRVAKSRSHSAGGDDVTGHLDICNGPTVTPPLAREDKNKNKKDKNTVNNDSEVSGARGTRLPNDWKPSPEEVAYCKTERPDLLPSRVAQNFFDYWIAKPGKEGRKTNWTATWRSWVRKEKTENAPRPRPAGQGPAPQALDAQRQASTDEAKRLLFGQQTTDEGSVINAP